MFTLYAHQNTELKHLASNRSFALFAEQDTGKTLPTLLHILNLLKDGQIADALIICPKAVMDSWYRDMEKFSPMYQSLLRNKITVINYDLVWRRAEFMRSWGCVVLDESHFIKHRTSRRSKFILKLGTLAEYRYILTGTPIGNSHWDEIWAPYNFLDPSILGKYSEFEKRYCILNQFYKPYRYINTAELKEKIFDHAYRVTKVECLDLPEKLLPERFSLNAEEKKLYKEMPKRNAEKTMSRP